MEGINAHLLPTCNAQAAPALQPPSTDAPLGLTPPQPHLCCHQQWQARWPCCYFYRQSDLHASWPAAVRPGQTGWPGWQTPRSCCWPTPVGDNRGGERGGGGQKGSVYWCFHFWCMSFCFWFCLQFCICVCGEVFVVRLNWHIQASVKRLTCSAPQAPRPIPVLPHPPPPALPGH